MKNHEIPSAEERLPITSPDAMEQAIRDIEQQEQLYSIALFDILGFSNLVQNNGTQIVLDLYNKLFLFSPISSGILIFTKTTFSFSRAWSTTKCLPHCALLSLSNLWMS